MELNLTEQYFLMSFRFDKTDPHDFGLVPSPEQNDLFIRTSDGSTWKKKNLYDFGWGNEVGFVKQPELDFEGLWYLLLNSSRIQENETGAASELLEQYPDELLTRVEQILNENNSPPLDQKYKRVFLVLKLELPVNRSKTIGKSYEQINSDADRWRIVSEKISGRTNSNLASQPTNVRKSNVNEQVSASTSGKENRPWWKFW